MRIRLLVILATLTVGVLNSCKKELLEYEHGDIKVLVEKGDEWLHDFPFLLGIKQKNAPQIAIWIEDTNGNYITTIFVSHKIATEGWMANKGNRRKESLPVWCYARGVVYSDGLYLPTNDKPVSDAISGATPKGSFDIKVRPAGSLRKFVVKVELNHSTDWNEYYPKNAREGDSNYSGGSGGSGQPAVVYATEIDLDASQKQYVASLVGHSSPDGSNGEISADVSSLSSALNIVKLITVNIQ